MTDEGFALVYGLATDDESYLQDFYPSRRIRDEAATAGVNLSMHLASKVLDDYGRFADETRGKAVLVRGTVPRELRLLLHADGFLVINDLASHERAMDKYQCYLLFDSLDIAYPRLHFVGKPSELDPARFLNRLPLVAKPRCGQRGQGVRLIETKGDLETAREDTCGELILQEYVGESRGKDVRFLFAGDDILPPVMRSGDGFLSNWSQGAIMEHTDLPPSWRELADRIRKASGLFYGTVDFLVRADGTPVACETNSSPGFEGYENATGVNFARLVVAGIAAFTSLLRP
ncbi:MAG: hypothetical protein NT080_14360 [Spirochaetes bacterium]|nr:hypothetical protein [Spirochaetota bacterium]